MWRAVSDVMVLPGYKDSNLYFVSPPRQLWRQRLVQRTTLAITLVASVFSRAFKEESRDGCINDAFYSVCPPSGARWVTSRSFWRQDRVHLGLMTKTWIVLSEICLFILVGVTWPTVVGLTQWLSVFRCFFSYHTCGLYVTSHNKSFFYVYFWEEKNTEILHYLTDETSFQMRPHFSKKWLYFWKYEEKKDCL